MAPHDPCIFVKVFNCLIEFFFSHIFCFKIDEDKQQYLNRWLPEKLSPNVRVVLSTIEGTVSHQTIRSYKSFPVEIICGPLDIESRKVWR